MISFDLCLYPSSPQQDNIHHPDKFLMFLCNPPFLPHPFSNPISIPRQPLICFIHYRLGYVGFFLEFLYEYKYIACIGFWSDFIQYSYFEIHLMFLQILIIYSCLLLSNMGLYGDTRVCLAINLLMGIAFVSSLGQLQIKLLGTLVHKAWSGWIFSFLGTEWLDPIVHVSLTF